MGFFDKIFKSKKPAFSEEFQQKPKPKGTPRYVAEMEIDGHRYLLTRFELGFHQQTDQNGKPTGDIEAGLIKVETQEVISLQLNDWVVDNAKEKQGKIRIYPNQQTLSEGAVEVILFENACCISLTKAQTTGGEMTTTMTISPARIKMNEEEFVIR